MMKNYNPFKAAVLRAMNYESRVERENECERRKKGKNKFDLDRNFSMLELSALYEFLVSICSLFFNVQRPFEPIFVCVLRE
jgi:hypothetical protein